MLRVNRDEEKQYVLAFCKGEEEGFHYFFKTYYAALCSFANRYVADRAAAEDVVTEGFLKLWEKREGFTNATALKSYLYKTVCHDCLKYLRDKQKMCAEDCIAADEASYLTHITRTETIRELYAAMHSLPRECRKVFELLYKEGKSMQEAAQELALSISTIKAQKARGLRLMRMRLHLSVVVIAVVFLWNF